MHADGAEHLVIEDDDDHARLVLHGGGKFLAIHHVFAIAGKGDHGTLRMHDLRRHAGRHAIAHGAVGRRQLRAHAAVAVEAVRPRGVIAGAVGQDGIKRCLRHDFLRHLPQVQRCLAILEDGRPLLIGGQLGLRFGRRMFPCGSVDGGHGGQHGARLRHAAVDHQFGLVNAAQLFGVRMDVHQALARHGCVEQRVAARRHFAEAWADGDDQVGIFHARGQFRVDADADIADVVRVGIVEQVLEAEGAGDGQVVAFRELLQVGAGLRRPGGAAQQHQRTLRFGQHAAQLLQLGIRWRRLHGLVGARVGDSRHGNEHVFRQGQHDGAGAAAGGDLEGARQVFGDALGAVDLRHPLGHLAVHAAVVDFLERFAVDEIVAHLADEQDHRRRILIRRVHADRGVGGARSARDEADARLARQLAVGFSHEGGAAFLAVDDEADARIVQGIEHVEVAFARHAKSGVDTMDLQGIDQDLAAGTGLLRHVRLFIV